MNDQDLSPLSFTEEESLWEIYKKSRSIPWSSFNFLTTLLVFGVSSIATFWSPQKVELLVRSVRDMAAGGLSLTLTVLGFLVAGFTIFATVTNQNMLVAMGSMRHDKSRLSWLKHSFFVLLRTFIYYLCYAVFCFLIVYMASPGGIASQIISLSPHPEAYRLAIAKVSFVALVTGQYFLLMQLKSFIFNIYHSVAANLRWKAEGND